MRKRKWRKREESVKNYVQSIVNTLPGVCFDLGRQRAEGLKKLEVVYRSQTRQRKTRKRKIKCGMYGQQGRSNYGKNVPVHRIWQPYWIDITGHKTTSATFTTCAVNSDR